ncbi:unnamed protein product [Adineta ricciae]|uniref:Uncharacterized protein n=1 Tax=Adineta ricciae TaxID=249248 RepID=A0A815MR75_ADIRI|nr:unnamed protein product [Adineta ricciae]
MHELHHLRCKETKKVSQEQQAMEEKKKEEPIVKNLRSRTIVYPTSKPLQYSTSNAPARILHHRHTASSVYPSKDHLVPQALLPEKKKCILVVRRLFYQNKAKI